MNYNKWIKLYTIALIIMGGSLIASEKPGVLSKAGVDSLKIAQQIADKHIPALTASLDNLAASNIKVSENAKEALQTVGLGTLTAVGGYIKSGAVAVKSTAVAIVSSPWTPWVAGGAVVTYGGYKTYRYMNPTREEVIIEQQRQTALVESKFRDCLAQNVNTTSRMPASCSNLAAQLSVYSGSEKVDKTMEDFRKYSKTPPNVPK